MQEMCAPDEVREVANCNALICKVISGSMWMNAGIWIPEVLNDYTARIFHLVALD